MLYNIKNGVLIKATPEHNHREKQIVLPSEIREIGPAAFEACRHVERVILPEGLKSISEGAFAYCRELETIIIPEGVTQILSGAFGYSGLVSIDLPESLEVIGAKAFTNSKLRTVVIPDRVKDIGYGAFSYCGDLRGVKIGKGLREIGRKVFFGNRLSIVCLSEFIEHIDPDAFYYSSGTVFYVKKDSAAYDYAIKNGYKIYPDNTLSLTKERINTELLSRCIKRNYFQTHKPDNEASQITLLNELPVHFYCLVESESVSRIHESGLYIPSLIIEHEGDNTWTDGYFFTETRIPRNPCGLVRIKISLRHNHDYFNETTGKKQVRVLKFNDAFLFCDAVHLYPDQCFFLDPYVCTESDMKNGFLELSGYGGKWNNICHLVIPDGFFRISDAACSNATNLETVHIGNGIYYIGNDSFCRCPKLTSVYIGDSVDASNTRAFNQCPELRYVTMSVHLKEAFLQNRALSRGSKWPCFRDCPNLTGIRFTDGSFVSI